ncbi:hypothetical protein P4O66_022927, partial [Electrophorus voltai]
SVENPSCAEIRDVLTAAGMNVYVESGVLLRRLHSFVRQLTRCIHGNGTETDSSEEECEFKSKKTMEACVKTSLPLKKTLFYVAEMIPKLKTRTQKSGGGDSGAQPGEGRKKGKKKK